MWPTLILVIFTLWCTKSTALHVPVCTRNFQDFGQSGFGYWIFIARFCTEIIQFILCRLTLFVPVLLMFFIYRQSRVNALFWLFPICFVKQIFNTPCSLKFSLVVCLFFPWCFKPKPKFDPRLYACLSKVLKEKFPSTKDTEITLKVQAVQKNCSSTF